MKKIIIRSFGGLTLKYYIRNFLFGSILPIFIMINLPPSTDLPIAAIVIFFINSLLYPYSRFVYESMFNHIAGGNNFIVDLRTMLVAKFFTVFIFWGFSLFIAPLGLLYLYYKNNEIANT